MKKIIHFISFIVLLYVISACDDYLTTDSKSIFTEESIFYNIDFATKSVIGIYEPLFDNQLYNNYMFYYSCDNDLEFSLAVDNGSLVSASHYNTEPGMSFLGGAWTQIYSGIERANICIEGLPKSQIWEGENAEVARHLYGEAVTLRAFYYYLAIQLWGDVPFVTKSTQAGDDFYIPKTDRDSIYEYLIEDLKNVQDYVPWMTKTQTVERMNNKGFVKGLRARMSLAYAGYSLRNKTFETRRGRYWEDYYKIANQECKEIMESGVHQLNPNFGAIFKTLHAYTQDLNYKEILSEIPFGRLISGQVATSIGMRFTTYDPKYGQTGIAFQTSVPYYYSFDRKDTRRDIAVEMYNYGSNSNVGKQWPVSYNTISHSKWRKSWINPPMGGDLKNVRYTGINWPLMRYSDIILMFAESENQINGPTQAAKDALSLVRQRAFPEETWSTKVYHYIDSVSANKESFFNAIVNERAWEFGGELLRKNDLIRWNLLGVKVNEMKNDFQKIINDDPSYIYHEKVPTYIFWKHKEDGETIEFLNTDYRLPGNAIPGYNRLSWLPLTSAANKNTYMNTINIVANGYDETKNNHLYHIYSENIEKSNGILNNDQIP